MTITSASFEMESGAALRAKAISASRSIMYCSTGAIFGYGSFAACARNCAAPLSATTAANVKNTTTLRVFLFIGFSCGTQAVHWPGRRLATIR